MCDDAVQDNMHIDDVIDSCSAARIVQVSDESGSYLFNQKALQRYVLFCAQETQGGGFKGAPSL